MRLRIEKIDYLANKITEELKKLKSVTFKAPDVQIAGTIRRVILNDLQREDEIEREAEELLRQHRQKIEFNNLSYSTLLHKAKQEIARRRKIVL
jgi:hypothetical protein